MKRFRQLLVGLDLSPERDCVARGSRVAARLAAALARRTGAEVTLLHSTWCALTGEDRLRYTPQEGLDSLEELADELRESQLAVRTVLCPERPWLEMTRRVLRGENDFVVAARREGDTARVLGRIARKLVRKCPCPVWLAQPQGPDHFRRVLVAADLTAVGRQAIELAAWVAAAFEAELHVVHAWQEPFALQMAADLQGHTEHSREAAEISAAAEAEIDAQLQRVGAGRTAQVHLARDAPAPLIERVAQAIGADLLVMGTVSRTGIAGLLVGNTAERLLDRIHCSLLTVKPDAFESPVRV